MFTAQKECQCLVFIYMICHRADHPMNEYLPHFVAARNTKTLASFGELALVIPRSSTDQFSWLFLSDVVRLWKLLPQGMFSGGILSSFQSAMNLCIQKA